MKKTTRLQKILLFLYSLILVIAIIELGFGESVLAFAQNLHNMDKAGAGKTYTILAIGESTTAGTGPTWPNKLELILNNRSKETRFFVYNEARPAVHTVYLTGKISENIRNYDPDMVISMMGVNDGYDWIYSEEEPGLFSIKNLKTYRFFQYLFSGMTRKRISRPKIPYKEEFSEKEYPDLISLGQIYLDDYGDITKAEESFEAARNINPENETAYIMLGMLARIKGDLDESEELLSKSIRLNPTIEAYHQLGLLFHTKGDDDRAVSSFNSAIELDPGNPETYKGLAFVHYSNEKPDLATESLKKSISLSEDDEAYTLLGMIYQEKGEVSKANEMFHKAVSLNPDNTKAATFLVFLDEDSVAEEFQTYLNLSVISDQEYTYYNATRYHYNKLYDILRKNRIKYVAMQYPTLNISIIKDFFSSEDQKDILFVSNENNFREALTEDNYYEYFVDDFALHREDDFPFKGCFGHTTAKSNRLIAENLANEILEYLQVKEIE
ncbi:tetratricopeptide repeat protein [Candidatus Woesearchaeota archaeon]|nr:tetratricopeptide repeat protein [Candidatus Woesearchaeota archaeon]